MYMNKPEYPVSVGDVCIREDYLVCDTKYTVLRLFEKNEKLYAECSCVDEFSGEMFKEGIYAYYLRKAEV